MDHSLIYWPKQLCIDSIVSVLVFAYLDMNLTLLIPTDTGNVDFGVGLSSIVCVVGRYCTLDTDTAHWYISDLTCLDSILPLLVLTNTNFGAPFLDQFDMKNWTKTIKDFPFWKSVPNALWNCPNHQYWYSWEGFKTHLDTILRTLLWIFVNAHKLR